VNQILNYNKPVTLFFMNETQVVATANNFEVGPVGIWVQTPSGITFYPWSNIWKAIQ